MNIDNCPRCAREEYIDSRSRLTLCSICLMQEAVRAGIEIQSRCDWRETVRALCKKLAVSQRQLAGISGVKLGTLKAAMKCVRPMPLKVIDFIEKLHPDCIKGSEGPAYSTTPSERYSRPPNKIKQLESKKTASVSLFRTG